LSLSKQVHLYSVDTSAFYTKKEKKIAKSLNKFYINRYFIQQIKKKNRTDNQADGLKHINKVIGRIKKELKGEMEKCDWVRNLTKTNLNERSIVSAFESSVTRIIGAEIGEITEDIIIVQAYYLKPLEDIIERGFLLRGEKYKCYTASAGQIRTKKTVFMKESVYDVYINTFSCGLTIDKINETGGINVNKYLAYLALGNSATNIWDTFNIRRSIVVDDFETNIKTKVDYIDEKTYEIKPRTLMDVLIPHTDGCGMMLPSVSKKAMMVRAPWIKGLLSPFRYNTFIKEHLAKYPDCAKVVDIYGKEYDIIKDKIEVIFTKSQFKMHKYYTSWQDYIDKYELHNCQAGKCNEEPDRLRNAKLNYQMLQTLEDISTEEIESLCSVANDNITKVSSDRDTMLKILGANKYNSDKTYMQQAIEIYPELLQDHHSKEVLKSMKKKLVREGYCGRIPINGKYTFLLPDLYAFSEYLFLGIEIPNGLLTDGEVSCRLFKKTEKLDVLRSPHLYMEHAIRNNVNNDMTKRWFISDGITTSTFDPISKILQFDVDGDKALVCEEEVLVDVAIRNSKDILPLYYEMAKAESKPLNNSEIYAGLKSAYTGGNIGAISNDITKVWNSENVNKEVIKYLCMENNFVIDYAKTLYKPTRPKHIDSLIKEYTRNKVPAFFMYAKDKDKDRIEPINESTVNRFKKVIKNPRLKFDMKAMGKLDYTMLMNISKKKKSFNEIELEVIEAYSKLNRYKGHLITVENNDALNNANYVNEHIRNAILEIGVDVYAVVDILIRYLFGKATPNKNTFWNSFGDIAVENLKRNISHPLNDGFIMCEICGERVEKKSKNSNTRYCEICSKKENIRKTLENRNTVFET